MINKDEFAHLFKNLNHDNLFDQNAIGIGYMNADGIIIKTNRYVEQILGYDKDELIGKSIWDITHKDDNIKTESSTKELISGSEIERKFKKRYRKKDGSYLWVSLTLGIIRIKDTDEIVFVGFVQDIAAEKQAEEKINEQNKIFYAIINSVDDYIFCKDMNSRYISCNKSFETILGLREDEIIGKNDFELFEYEKAKAISKLDKEVMDKKELMISESSIKTHDGRLIYYENYKTPLIDENGNLAGIVTVARDKTHYLEAKKQQMLAQSVFENTIEGIVITDKNNKIIATNPSFTRISGYTQEEAIGTSPAILKSNMHDADFYEKMWQDIVNDGIWTGEIWNKDKSGRLYPEMLTITNVKDKNGEVLHYIAVFSDISSIKLAERKLEHMAHYDHLTNLPNKILIEDRLKHFILRSKRHNSEIGIFFIDLDFFKEVNDAYGHSVGDEILKQVAIRLKKALREDDTIGRIGGDEFVVIVEEYEDEEDLRKIANKILEVFNEPFKTKFHIFSFSSSIGIATYPKDGEDIEILLKNADAAMYEAKAQGRNTYCFYKTEITNSLFERILLVNDLRRAMKTDEISLHYQPQINMQTNEITGMEALVRWKHPNLGWLSPDKFIKVAEDTRLIVPLGKILLEIACKQIRTWIDNGFFKDGWKMAVNISAVQFFYDDFFQTIKNILEKYNINPDKIEVEITETYIMQNPKKSIALLQKLRDYGISMSLDDFGMGYSSLSYLKKFPIDRIKIDRSFVKDTPGDLDDVAITKAIIALGKNMGLDIIAEGVEEPFHKQFLIEHGCLMAQGFLFSKALASSDFERLINTWQK